MPLEKPSPYLRAREKFNACIRTRYEDTLVPVREIARLAGITERNVYATVRRLGCRPRMRLAPGGGRRLVPLADTRPAKRGGAGLDAAGVRRAARAVRRAVEHQRKLVAAALADRDTRIAEKNLRRKCEADLRALSQLGQALRDLAQLEAAEKARADARARDAAEEAACTDELRRELARKLANLTHDVPVPDAPAASAVPVHEPRQDTNARIRLLSD